MSANEEPPKKRSKRWDMSGEDGDGTAKAAALAAAMAAALMQTKLQHQLPAIPAAGAVPAASNPSLNPAIAAAQAMARAAAAGAGAAAASNDPVEMAKRAAALQAQIQQRMQNIGVAIPNANKTTFVPTLKVDSQGREVDELGRVISEVKKTTPSTAAAMPSAKFELVKPPSMVSEAPQFFDDAMGTGRTADKRKRATLRFNKEGKYTRLAEEMRAKKALKDILADAPTDKPLNPAIAKIRAELLAAAEKKLPDDDVPNVEWWDSKVLPEESYEEISDTKVILREGVITKLVQHPPPVDPSGASKEVEIPLYLTKKERKKLRRQRRLQRELEKQEAVRQGLAQPAAPKVKISNLARVLGTEATMDPTKIEKEVRKQMQARQEAHEQRNQDRKLSSDQRKEKLLQKLEKDATKETRVVVFFARNLDSRLHRSKVNLTASQLHLKGCMAVHPDCCVIVAEGGPKAVKKMRKLLCQRIKWTGGDLLDSDNEDDQDDEGVADAGPKEFKLIWEGNVAQPAFDRFRFEDAQTQASARLFFTRRNVEHYWDMALAARDEILKAESTGGL